MRHKLFSFTGAAALSILISNIFAFPAIIETLAQDTAAQHAERQELPDRTPTSDAASQNVSNQGENAFVAPNFAAGGQRGPCSGLNTTGTS
jgi:hypothetical protein